MGIIFVEEVNLYDFFMVWLFMEMSLDECFILIGIMEFRKLMNFFVWFLVEKKKLILFLVFLMLRVL